MTKPSKCRSCGAEIWWLKNFMTGNMAPVDVSLRKDGNVEVDLERGTFRVMGTYEIGEGGYVVHFASCKDADAWRTLRAPRRAGARR
jgi:hypothetical protein